MDYKNGEIHANQDVQYGRNLIESISEPIFILNTKGEIIDLNNATVTIAGKERDAILHSNFEDYFHTALMVRKLISKVRKKGAFYDQPLKIIDKNGILIDVLCNATPFKDNLGECIGIIIIVREKAKQQWSIELDAAHKEKEKQLQVNKELEELNNSVVVASQYTLSLIEAIQDPLITLNNKGHITDMNQALIQSTGLTREELTGLDFFNLFTEKKSARSVHKEVFENGSISDLALTLKNKDGKRTHIIFSGYTYKNSAGEVAGIIMVARDVTEQKKIATALIEARVFAELATEIAEEAKKNAESAAIIAENAVKAKQQFLSNMSHEIRTPMNAIIGFTKIVLKTELTVKQLEYITAIKTSGDALIVLINDILDLAKVDSGKMTFEKKPFKMNASLEAMLHLFENKILEKNLKLIKEYDSNIPDVLVGDPVRLHQIILNLVNNAVKFTSKGSITVSMQLVYEDEDRVVIEFSISDTGIGIPENKLDHIFENFNQASSGTSRMYGGTGLGLAIVKQLVELQGGKIRVKSKLKKGSNFSFSLSFQKTKSNATLENDLLELDSEIKNIKVLVAEDIALNQLLMKSLLDDFGFERDIADNGKIAIEMLKKNDYDIILMDLQMPEMNGFETTEYIRKKMKSNIPIIALTADVTTVDVNKCKAVGMNDYLAKPVDEKQLYSKIVGILKKPQLAELSGKLNENSTSAKKIRCIDLVYLNQKTKSNPEIMMEMIDLYLSQTPTLINTIKQSFAEQNWQLLAAAAHKMIPSFSIMGMSEDFENIAKRIQEFANSQEQLSEIEELVIQLEQICLQACTELEEELNNIKNIKK